MAELQRNRTFTAELLDSGKILLRCQETDDAVTGSSAITLGRFMRKQHGLDPDAAEKEV